MQDWGKQLKGKFLLLWPDMSDDSGLARVHRGGGGKKGTCSGQLE